MTTIPCLINVSIAILTKNAGYFIKQQVNSIYQQKSSVGIEMIVVDSGSYDETISVARSYPLKLIQISSSEFSHGKTRNQAAASAQGDYIVFLNQDTQPDDGQWLSGLLNGFSSTANTAAVYSKIVPAIKCNPLDKRDILRDFPIRPKKNGRLHSFHTISCAIRRDLLIKYPFAEVEFGEDLEWAKRIEEKGYSILYAPESVVVHHHQIHRTFSATLKRYFDDTKFHQRVFRRYGLLGILKLPLITFKKSISDLFFILGLNERFIYKLYWLFRSPLLRIAEVIGANLAIFFSNLESRFSLVYELKNK
jgi:rhamnosyltransferase